MKLSKTQTALLLQIRNGKTLHYMPYMGHFRPSAYFSCEMKRCTSAAEALIKKGLIEKHGSWFKPEYRLTELGKQVEVEQ